MLIFGSVSLLRYCRIESALHSRRTFPNARVLLLEAGGSDRHPYIQIPLGVGKLQQHKMFDWSYQSEPEPNLNGRQLEIVRGKVLGGSSSVNIMVYTRGHRGDFDRWARAGATGWSYADLLPYFKRSEAWEDGETPWRGGNGPLGTQWAKKRAQAGGVEPGSHLKHRRVLRVVRSMSSSTCGLLKVRRRDRRMANTNYCRVQQPSEL
jgi:choline dehydrogenase-like flavoprotein